MTTFICQLPNFDDRRFFLWGLTTDSPTTILLTRTQVAEVYQERFGVEVPPESWAALDETGSDCPWAKNLEELFFDNRWGEDETEVEPDDLVSRLVCLTAARKGEWVDL
jgi:hypothetical protein